jgi:tetratricopeptide (TPR) repeat protein
MDLKREQFVDVLFTAAIVGVGLLIGNPIMAGVVGGIGAELAADLTRKGWGHVRQRLLAESGLLNHDLQQAMVRAFRQAIAYLEQEWWERSPRGVQMKREEPEAFHEASEALKSLRKDAENFCTPDRLGRAAGNDQVQRLLWGDETAVRHALSERLAAYFHGHDPQLVAFINKHLVQELAFRFGEDLKADRPESNRAWRAFQRLLLGSLQAGLGELQAEQKEMSRVLGALTAWAQRMETRLPEERESTGQVALEQTLVDARDQIIIAIGEGVESIARLMRDELDRRSLEIPPPAEPTRPPEVADFVGRESELADYANQLATSHLVVITGMAGVGKTALGAELARRQRNSEAFWLTFRQGGNDSVEALVLELARFLAVSGDEEPWRFLSREMQVRKPYPLGVKIGLGLLLRSFEKGDYVLCFDNFHVVSDDASFRALFEELRDRVVHTRLMPLKIIIMSRHTTGLVDDLGYDDLHGLNSQDARRMVSRAGVGLSSPLFEKLHQRVEGNPQFLKLFITWAKNREWGLAEVERFIEGLPRKRAVRNYLLRNVYQTLEENERRVLESISVFWLPVERMSVEEILMEERVEDVMLTLDQLLNKHVVMEEEEGRLSLHTMVREFAYQMLDRTRERREHRVRMHWRGGGLYEEKGDYIEASHHYFEAGEHGEAVELLTGHSEQLINAGRARQMLEQLVRFERGQLDLEPWVSVCEVKGEVFALVGEFDHAIESLGSILSVVDSQGLPVVDGRRMAEIKRKIGKIYERRGEHDLALEHYKAGISDLGDENAQTVEMARICKDIGWIYNLRGEYDAAIEICLRALGIIEETDYIQDIGDIYNAIGASYDYKGSYDKAIDHYEKGLAMFERAKDRYDVARLNNNLGVVYDIKGDYDRALEYFGKSLTAFKEIGDIHEIAKVYINLGQVYRNRGVYDEAIECYEKSLATFEKIEDIYGLAISYNNLGEIYKDQGEYGRAIECLSHSVEIELKIGYREGLSYSYVTLSEVYLGLGDIQQALEYCRAALENATEIGHQYLRGYCHWVFGKVYLSSMKTWRKAKGNFNEALAIFGELGQESEMAGVLEDMAKLRYDIGDQEAADNE